MIRGVRFALAAVALGGLTLHAHALEGQEWRWSGRVDPGDVLEIRGVNGEITATRASGGEIEVVAEKRSERDDLETVRIEVIEDADGVVICAVYPDRPGKKPNRCGRGNDYHMSTHDNDVHVDFTVRVPAGVSFRGHTVNGDVSATGLTGKARVSSVNGSIEVETDGFAEAHTVNGSIDAWIGATDWDGPLSFHTVNGGITVRLPSGTAADITAETVNGDLTSDFPLTVRGSFRIGMRKLEGQIGGGGEKLELRTVNGSIQLRRAG